MEDPKTLTRSVPPLEFRAAFSPGTVNEEQRTVEVTWTTGARVLRGFFDQFYEELSLEPKHVRMKRLNNGAPFLASHNGSDLNAVVGVVEPQSAKLDGKRGTAIVRFAKAEDDPEAEKVFRKVKDGILCNVSVGYRVHRLEETDETVGKVPVRRATDWEPFEISVVPMGADDGAGFRGAQDRAPNPCIFAAHKERHMADETKVETPAADEIAAVEQATRAAAAQRKSEAEAKAAADGKAAEAAVKAERERATEIRAIVRRTDLGDEFADKLIKSGAAIDSVRAAVLDHLARKDDETPGSSHVRFEAGDDARDKFVRGGCAAIFARSGQSKNIEAAKKIDGFAEQFKGVSTDPGEFRGMHLIDLARSSLERQGVSTRGLYGEALVARALAYRDGGMNTTSDFAILLETAVSKTFLGQYAITPTTWRRWCGVKSVQDFRTATFYRPGSFGKLDKVTEAGEIKHKNIPDGEKATITASTVGNIIGISRKAIVNDDLGAFRDLAAMLGQAAAYTVESDAFALVTANAGVGATMSDGSAVFHTNHANIGPAGVMSVATWDGAAAAMAAQKDPSKNLILDLSPAVLLCPRTLGLTAKQLNSSAADPTANKNSNVANPVANMVKDVVATAQITGTRHYFLADPGLYPVFAVGFIDGQEAPQIASEQSFEFDGLQMRIILDYGTAVLDYRGGVSCAGA